MDDIPGRSIRPVVGTLDASPDYVIDADGCGSCTVDRARVYPLVESIGSPQLIRALVTLSRKTSPHP
jgi:hypothetical protein